jgi:two-component system nitrate/nitrite sensor histidine kinase NarX
MDQDLLRARYATFAALALVFAFYLSAALPWNIFISIGIALITAALLTAVLDFWLRLSLRRAVLMRTGDQADQKMISAQAQIDHTLDFHRRVLDAHSEKEILDAIMQVGMDALGASGVSFVPYDEFRQSLPPLFHGQIPTPALQTWSESLNSPATRQICKACQTMHGEPGCVLLPSAPADARVQCFPFRINDREAGVLNFFHSSAHPIQPGQSDFFSSLIVSAGKAVQALRWRDREISAFRYLQTSAPRSDLPGLLANLLDNIQPALDVGFALIFVPGGLRGGLLSAPLLLARPEETFAALDRKFIEGVWQSLQASDHSLSLESITLSAGQKWRSLFAVPLTWRDEEPVGMLVLARHAAQAFTPRQLALIQTLAGQAALLIQNARLMVQVEYQAVVDERTRLAREIHDGLAQTLAFLKIQAAQMQNYLEQGQIDLLTHTLQSNYRTLNDAYLDARQAIDNLRRVPASSLREWMLQTAADFQESSGLEVDTTACDLSCDVDLPPNVQAQLIRMVQEALSNVRKHARARQVWISGATCDGEIRIAVRDDGIGFAPEQVKDASRYGLRGMRERAEMIGADFQVISRPGAGTTVLVQIPLEIGVGR